MADELVDVVNEKDEIIRQEWKTVCHKKGLYHRVAAVLLFDDCGKIWLQERSKKKSIGAGLLDYSASGHVPSGEDSGTAAYRELEEELGVVGVKLKEIKSVNVSRRLSQKEILQMGIDENIDENNGLKIRHIIKIYTGKYDGSFNVQKEEVEGVKAYSMEEIRELVNENPKRFTEGFKLGFKSYMGRR